MNKISDVELAMFMGQFRQACDDFIRRMDSMNTRIDGMNIKIDLLDEKVTNQEKFNSKLIGISVGVAGIMSLLGSFIGFFLQKLL